MKNAKFGRIIAIATTIAIILVGIMFIVCAAHLYFTGGEQPYSRETVGRYLIILAAPSLITLVLATLGVIYNITNSVSDAENTARTSGELLHSFASRYEPSSFPDGVQKEIARERDRRLTISWLTGDFSFLLCLTAIVLSESLLHFTIENLNGDVISALALILPLTICALLIHIPKEYFLEASCKKELETMKKSIKENGTPSRKEEAAVVKKVDARLVVRYTLFGIAVLMVVLGIINGGMADVLAKAVKICTECIGLG